ncbi:MAG: hypothetical protein DGJ47_000870, partial [Rickettsiaceae bacterium]
MLTEPKNREKEIILFLSSLFCQKDIKLTKMVGDAGLREYYRAYIDNTSYVIMDSMADKEGMRSFVSVGRYLQNIKISAPKIYHINFEKNILVLEDFGQTSLKKMIKGSSQEEGFGLYKSSIDLLIELQNKFTNNLDVSELNTKSLLEELNIFIHYYIPYKYNKPLSSEQKQEFLAIFNKILNQQIDLGKTISLQDYHSENIMVLNRHNDNKLPYLGLLDFQDAKIASPIYDIVSIMQDARIELPNNTAIELLRYYAQKMRYDFDPLYINYHILGAQRNCRILGVFIKKFIAENEQGYLQYL